MTQRTCIAILATSLVASLLGGGSARAAEFEQFVIEPKDSTIPNIAVYVEESLCSAVAVGPHTLLTAAHCVRDSSPTIPVWFGMMNQVGRCACHPDYFDGDDGEWGCGAPDSGTLPPEDVALCVFDKKFKDKHLKAVSPSLEVQPGDRVMITGFGCVGLAACSAVGDSNGLSDARHGWTRILEKPTPHTWITEADFPQGDSALCAGDSGGPVFGAPDWTHVVAIAREGCVDHKIARSALTPLSADSTVEWMCKWVEEDPEKRRILGLEEECGP
jgi:hypothetical protein